jgi:hypothetical protein
MAVYVDNWKAKYKGMIMCHVIADSHDELIEFMNKIGVEKHWIQHENTHEEHFDICLSKRKEAVSLGAIEINFRDYARMINKRRNEL